MTRNSAAALPAHELYTLQRCIQRLYSAVSNSSVSFGNKRGTAGAKACGQQRVRHVAIEQLTMLVAWLRRDEVVYFFPCRHHEVPLSRT